jgi:ribosome-associated protein
MEKSKSSKKAVKAKSKKTKSSIAEFSTKTKVAKNKTNGKTVSKTKTKKDAAFELVKAIVHGMEEKKGRNIVYLDLRNIPNSVCEFFVLCDAESTTQVNALAYSVEESVKKKTGESPWHMEGLRNNQWILIDYVNVVAHVFQTPYREFYNIEKLWADAEQTVVNE